MSIHDPIALDRLFLEARTHTGWQVRPVELDLLRRIHNVARMGPTSVNSCPLRIAFIVSPEAREKLLPTLSPGNRDKTRSAPVTAIFAWDGPFFDELPRLFPHADVRARFADDARLAEETVRRNAVLQAAYFMIAARGFGLDCGPMSGFDRAALDTAVFPEGEWHSDCLCNLCYGTPEAFHPR